MKHLHWNKVLIKKKSYNVINATPKTENEPIHLLR